MFIAYKTFELTRHETYDNLQSQLEGIIKPGMTSAEGLFKKTSKPFYGSIERGRFRVRRVIPMGVRNDFRPTLFGEIIEDGNHRTVRVEAKIPIFHMLTMAVFTFGLTVMPAGGLTYALVPDATPLSIGIVFAVIYLLCVGVVILLWRALYDHETTLAQRALSDSLPRGEKAVYYTASNR